MSKNRYAAKIDSNQPQIVGALRHMGYDVEIGKDDILVGTHGLTLWYEIKSEDAVSRKTGRILESKIKKSQKDIRLTWRGHYKILSSLDEILDDIRVNLKKFRS